MVPCSHLSEVRRACVVPNEGAAWFAPCSGRGEMICALSFLCGLFSDDPRLRMPTYRKIQWWVCGTRFSAAPRSCPCPCPCPCPCHPQSAFSPSDPCRPEQPKLFG